MTAEIEALLAGPESTDMLAFHLRNMADGQVDGIDADRLSRAANLMAALTALQAELASAVARAEKAEGALMHEVKRSRRHLAQSTLDLVAALTPPADLAARIAKEAGNE